MLYADEIRLLRMPPMDSRQFAGNGAVLRNANRNYNRDRDRHGRVTVAPDLHHSVGAVEDARPEG